MKYAILSDVHANLQALDAVIADVRRRGAETFVSLGDTVGYGPLPAEAIRRVRETCAIALAGNHDDAVSGRIDGDDFIELASDAVQRHRDALDPDALGWLKSLPHTAEIEGAACTHGDLVAPAKFYYIEDEADAAANFQAADFQLAFVGHSHRPALFVTGASGRAYKTDPQDFTLEDGKRYIVNVGSVGYPRESGGICRSSYVLYDSTARTVEFRFLPFAVSSVLQRGHSPKKSARTSHGKLFGWLVAFALAASAACVWIFSRAQVPQAKAVVPTPKDDSSLVVTNLTLPIGTRTRDLRANLYLSQDSPPVDLRLRYRDENSVPFPDQMLKVKRYISRNLIDNRHPLPPGACEVELTVLKAKKADTVSISRFDPVTR